MLRSRFERRVVVVVDYARLGELIGNGEIDNYSVKSQQSRVKPLVHRSQREIVFREIVLLDFAPQGEPSE